MQVHIDSITIMGFSDCPNTKKAEELMRKLNIPYEVTLIKKEDAVQFNEFYGSPSFLIDGKNIENGVPSWSCRIVDFGSLERTLIERFSS